MHSVEPVPGVMKPVLQGTQVMELVEAAKVFGGQGVQAAAPAAAEYLPAWQSRHAKEPNMAEYWPASQLEHVEAPAAAENLPGTQNCLSLAPPTQADPAGHVVPEAEDDPAWQ